MEFAVLIFSVWIISGGLGLYFAFKERNERGFSAMPRMA